MKQRTNNALVQAFNVNDVNELTTRTRTGTLTVSGETTGPATNVTVNGSSAAIYADYTFAKDGFADGTNTFTAIASNTNGAASTNLVSVSLPATQSFAYDANGNLTSDGRRGLEYDDENQLMSVVVTNQFKKEFAYDDLRRLRVRKEFTWVSNAWLQTNKTRFIYDGLVIIQTRDADNGPKLSFTRGLDLSGSLQGAGGTGGLLAMSQHSTTPALLSTALYHSDGNGNVTCLVSTNGLVVAKALFEPFGKPLTMSGPLAGVNPFWFSSQLYDADTGFSHYLYRVYSADLQRWLTKDPIQEVGGINLYWFVRNRPVEAVDLFGLLVYCIFDQGTGTLTCTDEDTGKTEVIQAFSGGTPSLKYPLGADPVPAGCYDLLHRGPKAGFRLEGRDEKYGDDDYEGRNELRLHGPGRSTGCITAKQQGPWDKLEKLIRDTQTTSASVDSKSRNPLSPPTETLTKYGEIKVIDTGKMPVPPNSPPPGSVPPKTPAPGPQLPTGPRTD